MKFLKHNWIILISTLGFVITRLYKLTYLPIFLDEALYLRWTLAIKHNWANWLLPLFEDGQPPLFFWLAALLDRITHNSLITLRLLSAIFGVGTLLLTAGFVRVLFQSKSITWLTQILIIFSPFVLLYDRLGMRDSAITACGALMLYGLAQRLFNKKPGSAYLITLALILGLMIKSTSWFYPLIALLSYLFFHPKLTRHDFLAAWLASLPVWFFLITKTANQLVTKNQIFLISSQQLFNRAWPNLLQTSAWYYQYLTWPVLVVIFAGVVISYQRHRRAFQLLSIFMITIIGFEVLFAEIYFPRYFLMTTIVLLSWGALGTHFIIQRFPRIFKPLILAAILSLSIYSSIQVINNIQQANLPEIERWQYVTGWPSGYGLDELIDYLKRNPPDVLITEIDDLVRSGLPYLWPDQSINIYSLDRTNWLSNSSYQQVYQSFNKGEIVYLTLNILEDLPGQFQGQLIEQFPRPENKSSIKLYLITNIL